MFQELISEARTVLSERKRKSRWDKNAVVVPKLHPDLKDHSGGSEADAHKMTSFATDASKRAQDSKNPKLHKDAVDTHGHARRAWADIHDHHVKRAAKHQSKYDRSVGNYGKNALSPYDQSTQLDMAKLHRNRAAEIRNSAMQGHETRMVHHGTAVDRISARAARANAPKKSPKKKLVLKRTSR